MFLQWQIILLLNVIAYLTMPACSAGLPFRLIGIARMTDETKFFC